MQKLQLLSMILAVSVSTQLLPVSANSPIPDEVRDEAFNPLKATDAELLSHWCNALHDPVFFKWRASKKLRHLPCSCLLKIAPDGTLVTATIYKSSGSQKEDKQVIDLIQKVALPKMGRSLPAQEEIVLQFFKSVDLRMKWKQGDTLSPIGPLANTFDPKD